MKLTKEQFVKYVNTYQRIVEEENQIWGSLNLTGSSWTPGEWVTEYYNLLSDLCELDEDNWMGTTLDWYCFETEFGRRNVTIYVKDTRTDQVYELKIKNAAALYDYITNGYVEEDE